MISAIILGPKKKSGGIEKAGLMCSPKKAAIRSGLKLIIVQSG